MPAEDRWFPAPCRRGFERGKAIHWTRDPFDRVIIAQAEVESVSLLSRDQPMRDHFKRAVW
jgi:PIN domain nuclease of toxin-antitoxin system